MKPKMAIAGMGEVGRALYNILKDHYPIVTFDKEQNPVVDNTYVPQAPEQIEVLNVCFPYSDTFVKDVKQYQEELKPKYTVVHSTVPVGTSKKCNAIHSPIRGLHPNLESGIRTFVKFLGGHQASEVADYFRRAGLRVMLFDNPETTEASKLFDTEYYRACIEFAHRVKRYCDKNNLNFSDVYRLPNITYNEGYTELGHSEYVRPVLEPIMKPIGGHCVQQNSKLIDD